MQPKIQFNFHTYTNTNTHAHHHTYIRQTLHKHTNLHHTNIQMKSYLSRKLHNAHVCISASIVLLCSVVSLLFSPLSFSFHFQFWFFVDLSCYFGVDLICLFLFIFPSNYHFCMPDRLCLSTLYFR